MLKKIHILLAKYHLNLFAEPLAQLARLWAVEREVAGCNPGGTRNSGLKFPDNIMLPVFKILF